MSLAAILLLVVSASPSTAAPALLPLRNAGFEEGASHDSAVPEGWFPANEATRLATDNASAFEGLRALRLDYQPPFVGSVQDIDARPWQGQLLVLSARLKADAVGDGTAGLWIRGNNSAGAPSGFASTYADSMAGTTGWQPREVRFFVGPDTRRLAFGASLGAPGTLRVDAFELKAYPVEALPPLTPVADAYLFDVLELIEQRAYFSLRVDWNALRREARALASGAQAPADTYPAVMRALAALGDNHSKLIPAAQARGSGSPGSRRSTDGILARRVGNIGYLRVPAFGATDARSSEAYSRTLHDHLERQARQGVCGWIIDLRSNTGGNMYPMIRGLSGLLGKGRLGYFVFRDGREPWASTVGTEQSFSLAGGLAAPVAVLQDGLTASSGEATLISFVGRANTRRFGAPSMGLSTGNQAYPLSDGAMLVLTTSRMADRNGKVYGGSVPPDELVGSQGDPEAAARRWLEAQPACRE